MDSRFLKDDKILSQNEIEGILAAIWNPIVPVQRMNDISHYVKNENNFLVAEDKKGAYVIGRTSDELAKQLNEYRVTIKRL